MILKPDHCNSCVLHGNGKGFVPASGDGSNGVLIVAEAAGEHEADEGMPLVGKAGYYTWQNLQRVGIERDGFRVHNVLSCRPPENKLVKMAYEQEAITHCAPFLDQTIAEMAEKCKENGKHFTIVTLGRTAFMRVMGIDNRSPIMRNDYLCYPFRSERYGAWVLAADHPSYLMRGNNHLLPVFKFAFTRALEIAENGLKLYEPTYLRDPNPSTFAQWVTDFKRYANEHPKETFLAFDIETPYKMGVDEDSVAREDDDDYTILRCSFSYQPNSGISVRWNSDYRASLEDIFSTPFPKVGWNSENYDLPRIRYQCPVSGDCIDAMLCWHVLNSALPKGLGFVTPFYCKDVGVWKYKSDSDPAGYNAQDSDMTLRNFMGIKNDLIKNNQWEIYDRHVTRLNRVLGYMSGIGVLRDEELRLESEKKLQNLLDVVEASMEESVPVEARRLKVYKKTPKDTTGMVEVDRIGKVKRCSVCDLINPKKSHFKTVGKKKALLGLSNPCEMGEVTVSNENVKLWAKPLEFKVSKVGLTNYQKALKHQAMISRRERKVTFDEQAIIKLAKKYPNDKLYPKILEHRHIQKLLSTYIGVTQPDGRIRGGMAIGSDGAIHTTYTHNPSTLRLASQQPNLQQLPRG